MGEDHVETAASFFKVGEAQHRLNKIDDALENYQRALSFSKNFFGPYHEFSLILHDSICRILLEKGDFYEAR